MIFNGHEVTPGEIAGYEQRLSGSLDALHEIAQEIIDMYGDSFLAELHLSAAIGFTAARSEERQKGTGIAGISGMVAHFILTEMRSAKAKSL